MGNEKVEAETEAGMEVVEDTERGIGSKPVERKLIKLSAN